MDKDLLKERIRQLFVHFPWRHVILGGGLILGFAYLFYDRWAPYKTESGVVIAVVYAISQILSYYTGSSKDKSDADKVEHAKKLTEASNTGNP